MRPVVAPVVTLAVAFVIWLLFLGLSALQQQKAEWHDEPPASAIDEADEPEADGLLLLMLGGNSSIQRQNMLRKTWLDPRVDWGVNFRAFVFVNQGSEKRRFTSNKVYAGSIVGRVTHDCQGALADPKLNKCCLRARQLRFAAEYLEEWPEMKWVALIDDDHYVVVSNLFEALKNETEKVGGEAQGLMVGNKSCRTTYCDGICGGAGIYFNASAIRLMQKHIKNMEFESWVSKMCEWCTPWADVTTFQLVHEINRREVEKSLFLGTDRWSDNPMIEKNVNNITEPAILYVPAEDGFAWWRNKNDRRFAQMLGEGRAKIFHYDYRRYTHLIHQTMLKFAKSFDGAPPPKELPKFASLQERETGKAVSKKEEEYIQSIVKKYSSRQQQLPVEQLRSAAADAAGLVAEEMPPAARADLAAQQLLRELQNPKPRAKETE